MGGLLALILAGRFNPEKVMLYAPALVLRRKLAYLSPLLKFFIPRMRSDYDEKHEDPEMIFLAQEYWMHHETKMIASVEKLRRIALKSLVRITSPTLVFVSQKDMTVPPKAADLILDGIPTPNKKKILLNESSHLITQDEEKEKTAEISVHWLKNQTILTP